VADAEVDLDLTKSAEAAERRIDIEASGPQERATRRFNKHSKDHRPDLPQIVLGMALTSEGA
jgi:hypothetical protein